MRTLLASLSFLLFALTTLPAQTATLDHRLAALRDALSQGEIVGIGLDGKPIAELTSSRECVTTAEGQRRVTGWLRNLTDQTVRVREIVLSEATHTLPKDTGLYAEAFQMLSQTAGTLGQPLDLDAYTDRGHYRLREPEGFRSVYGMALLTHERQTLLIGFEQSQRFAGRIDLAADRVRVVLDAEGLGLAPGKAFAIEPLWLDLGPDHNAMLARFGQQIAKVNHVQLPKAPPAGWCSWYCFGPKVTAPDVARNLDVLAKELPQLRYVQIDDGYQPHMGDWLATGKAFGGDIKAVLRTIRDKGFVPAIWVAPFIADGESQLFHDHPDWFVKDDDGKPLRSDKVGFGGWRMAPWYCLDGTHPEAQQYLTGLFRTLREDWGCGYFKLDANFWGAIHGGHFHDPNATRVEAYRRGMQAIRQGAGEAFVLGCNHPMWASIGLIDGSRSSMDVDRTFEAFARTGRENLLRSWQNGLLWWNDPDCLLVAEPLSAQEVSFHSALLLATGGMLLSGDDLTRASPERRALLAKAMTQRGVAAKFDAALQHGVIERGDGSQLHVFLRWDDSEYHGELKLAVPSQVQDFWTGADLGTHDDYKVELPPRSGRVLAIHPH